MHVLATRRPARGTTEVTVTASVLLVDPKYPHNVGAAVRAASCLGAGRVAWSGERVVDPHDPTRPRRGRRLPREERLRAFQDVELRRWVTPAVEFITAQGRGLTPVAVEFRRDFEVLPYFTHPENALYVFGPEDGTLPGDVLSRCHRHVRIPTEHCVNLGAAVYLILYDRHVKREYADTVAITGDTVAR